METSASMLQSLTNLSNSSMSAGGKPYRKSEGNLRKITSQIFAINRVPAHKQGHKAPLRAAKSAKSSKKSSSPMSNMLASFQSITLVKRPSVLKKTAKKAAPRQRAVKMEEDQSIDDMLSSLLSKASTSISQKSRTIANKNIKKSKTLVEKAAREAARRATASRSSTRASKKPEAFKPSASTKASKKKSPK